MERPKAVEILEINLKEAGKKMPPDVQEALKIAIRDIHICIETDTPIGHTHTDNLLNRRN